MDCRPILDRAEALVKGMRGQTLDIITIQKPEDISLAIVLSKITSKLSPVYANSIEHSVAKQLNSVEWGCDGRWVRQDPGFPDVVLQSDDFDDQPGIEIKTWYPFATEITARFRESQTMFSGSNTDVVMVVWIPEHIVWGKAVIIGVWCGTAASIAKARDDHYHRPPEYLVFEPEDTSDRTSNLQQTNTNGYRIQCKGSKLKEAKKKMVSLGIDPNYDPSPEYQSKLKILRGSFEYRLDTNYAKMDRIEHEDLESFKSRMMDYEYLGKTIKEWSKILSSEDKDRISRELQKLID